MPMWSTFAPSGPSGKSKSPPPNPDLRRFGGRNRRDPESVSRPGAWWPHAEKLPMPRRLKFSGENPLKLAVYPFKGKTQATPIRGVLPRELPHLARVAGIKTQRLCAVSTNRFLPSRSKFHFPAYVQKIEGIFFGKFPFPFHHHLESLENGDR